MEASNVPAGYSDRLYNEDLAPVTERTWTGYSLFAMWMADVHSIGGYTFAAGLFFLGLAGWEVFLALLVGITIVYFLMNLTGHRGPETRHPLSGSGAPQFRVVRGQHTGPDPGDHSHLLVRHPDVASLSSGGHPVAQDISGFGRIHP